MSALTQNRFCCIFILTLNFKSYILQGGMKCERKSFCWMVICIISILLISTGFSPGDVMADNCAGGAGCLVCAEQSHGHIPGAAAGMENPACPPNGQNSTCGFEAGQEPDVFQGLVSSIRSYHTPYNGIFAAGSNQYGQIGLNDKLIPLLVFSGSAATTPIYLLNQSQLC